MKGIGEIQRWVKGILLFGVGLFIFLSILSFSVHDPTWSFCRLGVPVNPLPSNFGGIFGSYLSGLLIFLFGEASFMLVVMVLFLGWSSVWGEKTSWVTKTVSTAGLLVICCSMFALRGDNGIYATGGFTGVVTNHILIRYFGEKGMFLVSALLGIGFLGVGHVVFISPFSAVWKDIQEARAGKIPLPEFPRSKPERPRRERETPPDVEEEPVRPKERQTERIVTLNAPEQTVPRKEEPKEKKERPPAPKKEKPPAGKDRKGIVYQLPSLDLLKIGNPTQKETKEDLERCAQVIEETVAEFGIEGEIVQINQGPRVTMYELQLGPGIPLQKVHKITDNIAMSLKATTIRIVAPLPGKSTVGIEVPNREISMVYLREILTSKEFGTSKSKLSLAIGKDILGRSIVGDMKNMPHVLIAGATGSGKTVCLNSFIASILYKATPDEVRFLMIDPKMVELTFYEDLPHLLLPPVIEIKKAVIALKWLIGEMERRYKLFAQEKVRNLESHNEQHKDEPLPHIVVVIDELADLMMIARNEIENSVIRLAQLSRAAGIHLILATQRPSVNVITGVIKANLPCRIAFQVASKFDSATILDTNGAEKLLGRGDLLYIPPGSGRAIRVQGCFIADPEIEAVCEFYKQQQPPNYQMDILDTAEEEELPDTTAETEENEIYHQAKRIVLDTRIASISMLQRRLQIGFNRAARLIEKMEQDGIVGPYREGKPREVVQHYHGE